MRKLIAVLCLALMAPLAAVELDGYTAVEKTTRIDIWAAMKAFQNVSLETAKEFADQNSEVTHFVYFPEITKLPYHGECHTPTYFPGRSAWFYTGTVPQGDPCPKLSWIREVDGPTLYVKNSVIEKS